MSSSYTNGPVNVSGLLQTLLESGFNTYDCIGELLDNSLDSGANNIIMTIDTNSHKFIFSDDGCGMTKTQLGDAHVLHNRSDISVDKAGRFGIGGKHARSHITQNKGLSTTISKTKDIDSISEINIDYPEAIRRGILSIVPHGLTCENQVLWEKYLIKKSISGTIVICDIDVPIMNELLHIIKSCDINTSIRYFLGVRYYRMLLSGKQVTINIDNTVYKIYAVDPLCLDKIKNDDKQSINITLYKTSDDELIACFPGEKNKLQYRQKGYRDKSVDFVQNNHVQIGKILINIAYCHDWSSIQKEHIRLNGITLVENGSFGISGFREKLNECCISRGNKILMTVGELKATSGDKSIYPYYPNTHYDIQFTPDLDKIFGVTSCKSRLILENIPKGVTTTRDWLIKRFINKMHTKYNTPIAPIAPITPIVPQKIIEPKPSPSVDVKKQVEPKPIPLVIKNISEITISKTQTDVIINSNGIKIQAIPYYGEYHITEKYIKNNLDNLGPDKFRKWIRGLAETYKTL
jgi:hypothetical protein